jgi:hypothetical protein
MKQDAQSLCMDHPSYQNVIYVFIGRDYQTLMSFVFEISTFTIKGYKHVGIWCSNLTTQLSTQE